MRAGLRQVLLDKRSMDRPEIVYFDQISQRKNVDKYGRYGKYRRIDSVPSERPFRIRFDINLDRAPFFRKCVKSRAAHLSPDSERPLFHSCAGNKKPTLIDCKFDARLLQINACLNRSGYSVRSRFLSTEARSP